MTHNAYLRDTTASYTNHFVYLRFCNNCFTLETVTKCLVLGLRLLATVYVLMGMLSLNYRWVPLYTRPACSGNVSTTAIWCPGFEDSRRNHDMSVAWCRWAGELCSNGLIYCFCYVQNLSKGRGNDSSAIIHGRCEYTTIYEISEVIPFSLLGGAGGNRWCTY